MKIHPISEKLNENTPQITSPAGQDPSVEKPHDSSNPYEKLPTSPEDGPHFFYTPGLHSL